ncbi:diacylglycerol/lipid kinase family protein [Novosphingobium decolorationis]|uniref:Diacylglycerol kinase n=1 Tax=Novosphingobium decolorationis TaxID=2698673 RepID=A0ABX8E646_9SPHN|nr:diacylglycerol kinase family protein [Novosphingobium decolorationis]QVM84479.1 diacylglycerol kinase [Novosphingobium decolorationis]
MEQASQTPADVAQPDDSTPGGAKARRLWLVCNPASGSNDAQTQREAKQALESAGFDVARTLYFPDDPAPKAADLDEEGVEVVATFGGDGTVHAVVTGLFGWGGAVLVLPGGTMNLLAKTLHGPASADEIAARLESGEGRRVRTPVIDTRHGTALTGVLAGPGTIWNEVREALRDANLIEVVATARQAISYSTNGPKVVCDQSDCGREDGYAAITVNPGEEGLSARGYYAESLADYAGQGIALLNRDFRNGPHDDLGVHQRIRLVCPAGEPMGLLIDGEPFDGEPEEIFELAPCEVDLIATREV